MNSLCLNLFYLNLLQLNVNKSRLFELCLFRNHRLLDRKNFCPNDAFLYSFPENKHHNLIRDFLYKIGSLLPSVIWTNNSILWSETELLEVQRGCWTTLPSCCISDVDLTPRALNKIAVVQFCTTVTFMLGSSFSYSEHHARFRISHI